METARRGLLKIKWTRQNVSKTAAYAQMRQKEKGKALTDPESFACFLTQCSENLHIVFRLESSGDDLDSLL